MDLVELLQRNIQEWKEKWAKLKEENVNLRGFRAMVMEDPKKYSKPGIGHNGPPTESEQKQEELEPIFEEGEEQDNPSLFDIVRKNPKMTYNEATKVQEDMRLTKEVKKAKGVCITGALKKDLSKEKEIDYHRYWKNMYEKEHKLRQEAQGETTIVKGIGMNSPEMKEAQARIKELENSLSIALEINEEHQRYNGKLQTRVTDLEEDNKKLANQVDDQVERARKAGL